MEYDEELAKPLTESPSVFDEGFYSFDSSFNSSAECFLNVSELSNKQSQSKFKAVVCPSNILSDNIHEGDITAPKPILCGLSSFQCFNMSTKSLKVSSRPTKSPALSSKQGKDECKENALSKVSGPSICPTILKHKRKGMFGKYDDNIVSPIKSLGFSPSRFLNTSSDQGVRPEPACSRIVKDLFLANSSFDIDDSGIGNSYIDTGDPMSSSFLTSTPVSSKKAESDSPWSPEHFSTDFPLESTPKSSKETECQESKTPIICKYLNESTPRTPTPFKCPFEMDTGLEMDSNDKHCEEMFQSPERDSCFKRPSPVGPNWPSRRWRNKSRGREKTARKALILEHESVFSQQKKKNAAPLVNKSVLPRLPRLAHENEHSSLLESKGLVEQRVTPHKTTYIYRTRQRKAGTKRGLDKHWVSVVCGHSHDQKAMTEAARRCLRRSCQSKVFKKL